MALNEYPAAAHREIASHGAAKGVHVQGLLGALSPRPSRRVGALRLAFTAVLLYVTLWVSVGTVTAQLAKSTASSTQVLLTTPNLRTDEVNLTAHSPQSDSSSANSASSGRVVLVTPSMRTEEISGTPQDSLQGNTSSLNTTQIKLCEKINVGHIEKEFYRPDNCLTRTDIQQIVLELVKTLVDVFAKHDIPYWLDSGTLLGSYREKTVIPHDVDADIGISKASFIQLRDNKLEFPSEYELHVLGSKLYRQGTRFVGLPARLVHKDSGIYTDIFVFLDDKKDPKMFGPEPSNCFHGCHRCRLLPWGKTEFRIPRDWVYPLQECAFGGRTVTCPAKPELYLDHLYGPNYMTPERRTR